MIPKTMQKQLNSGNRKKKLILGFLNKRYKTLYSKKANQRRKVIMTTIKYLFRLAINKNPSRLATSNRIMKITNQCLICENAISVCVMVVLLVHFYAVILYLDKL